MRSKVRNQDRLLDRNVLLANSRHGLVGWKGNIHDGAVIRYVLREHNVMPAQRKQLSWPEETNEPDDEEAGENGLMAGNDHGEHGEEHLPRQRQVRRGRL